MLTSGDLALQRLTEARQICREVAAIGLDDSVTGLQGMASIEALKTFEALCNRVQGALAKGSLAPNGGGHHYIKFLTGLPEAPMFKNYLITRKLNFATKRDAFLIRLDK